MNPAVQRLTLVVLLILGAVGCARRSAQPVAKAQAGASPNIVASVNSASSQISSDSSVARRSPAISLWQTPIPAPSGSSAVDPQGSAWRLLYTVGGPQKVWNIDASRATSQIGAKQARDAGTVDCAWALVEWFDGSFTRPGAHELALLLEPRCDNAPVVGRRHLVIAASHLRQVATGALFVVDRVVLEVDVPHAVLAGFGTDTDGDGREEFVVDTTAAPGGSARLIRVNAGAIEVLHDFGPLGAGCRSERGNVLLSYRRTPHGVELRDESHVCDPG